MAENFEYACSVDKFNNKISPYLHKAKIGEVDFQNENRSFFYRFNNPGKNEAIEFAKVMLKTNLPQEYYEDNPIKITTKPVTIKGFANKKIIKDLGELLTN